MVPGSEPPQQFGDATNEIDVVTTKRQDLSFDSPLCSFLCMEEKSSVAVGKKRGRKRDTTQSESRNDESNRTVADGQEGEDCVKTVATQKVKVSSFDYSVENHFRVMEMIAEICGEDEPNVNLEDTEVIRLSSAITFLREWKHFKYEPKVIKFVDAAKNGGKKIPAIEVTLPQFSAAAIPKAFYSSENAAVFDGTSRKNPCQDYVMHVGGPIWALDWCPRFSGGRESHNKEFIAVSAHPSGSTYHKLCSPLTGRGAIQIWCVVTATANEGEISLVDNRGRKHRSSKSFKENSTVPKRPKGRPRKKPVEKPPSLWDGDGGCVEPLAIQLPGDIQPLASPNETLDDVMPIAVLRDMCRKKRRSKRAMCTNDQLLEASVGRSCCSSIQEGCHEERSRSSNTDECTLSFQNHQKHCSFNQEPAVMDDPDASSSCVRGYEIPMDVAIPRLVFCLAHNGKVAWDAKWRPYNTNLKECKHQMGFLAVLLGNGSLEVWEVPLPQTVKAIYSSVHREGTDPRFLKLEPVFRCGVIRSGGMQSSLPLTVEWSASGSQEYLLVGCHDGTVALWKFSMSDQSKDTRPLLCFTADKFPIRSVAWAPHQSDPEAANVIVTAGHGGIKFWDIRDPFRPLWDLHSFPHHVLGLDWIPDPRCITFAFDDGTLKFISLSKAANDTPFTGYPFGATKGFLHSYPCSSFAMWSLHVSRNIGLVAYCTADGNVLCFQMTTKAVEKESLRYRTPHFMCVSMAEEKPAIVLNMSASEVPITRKKSLNPEETAVVMYDDQKGENQLTPNVEDKPLALCYGDDLIQDSELEGTEYNMPAEENKGDPGLAFHTLPPKIVAMHRVRWNVNRDGARWLCSGGAAGIVRCQEITIPSVRKK